MTRTTLRMLALLLATSTAVAQAQDDETTTVGARVEAEDAMSYAGASPTGAEATEEDNPYGATISLNQDRFFGFYGTLAASYRLNPGLDFTFYSILWTLPAFGEASPTGYTGQGIWTEVGAGVNFSLLDGALNINPQLGFLSGRLLSNTARPRAFEGIVPNLVATYDAPLFEAEVYFGYYLAIRGNRDNSNDFIHYWANAGIKPLGFIREDLQLLSIGLHWEHLIFARGAGVSMDDLYQWIGPYIGLSLPAGVGLWFAAGWDLTPDDTADFYKATVSFSF